MRGLEKISGVLLLIIFSLLPGCGGGGSGGSATPTAVCTGTTPTGLSAATSNTMPLYESTCAGTVNIPVVTLHVCVPGTTTCEDVPNVLVDYGSTGLRLSHTLSIAGQLPQEISNGQGLYECYAFVSGYNFGPVVTADISLGTTVVTAPLQISDASLSAPSSCSSGTQSAPFQPYYNGILGVLFPQYDNIAASAYYYEGSGYVGPITPAQNLIVQNPIFLIPNSSDNNGVVITGLPAVNPSTGTSNATGTLQFGVTLGSYTRLETNSNGSGEITATFPSGGSTNHAFFDTGSNGFFFEDSSISSCTSSSLSGFFCSDSGPLSTLLTGANSVTFSLAFFIVSAQTLFNTGNTQFSSLGGPQKGVMDLGFPAFLTDESSGTPYTIGLYWTSSTSGVGYFLIK